MLTGVRKLKATLSASRKITICLDGWTKKGLSSSFLGISACFFDPVSGQPQHALLNLDLIHHPHSGEKLSKCIDACLAKWEIPVEKVLLVVSDNGSNIVKAVRLLREQAQLSKQATDALVSFGDDLAPNLTTENEADDEIDDNSEDNELGYAADMTNIIEGIPFRRLGCLCHTLQLLIQEVYNCDEYREILQTARRLVGKVRKSSIAMQKIVSRCGKTIISDNSTRWNSTYLMINRLLEIKVQLNEVLHEMKIDSLLTSEWGVLQEIVSLLEPFREQTDILQTDATSLSNVIPSLLELECHLEQFTSSTRLVKSINLNMKKRFAVLLEPSDLDFNPLPVAACLLDPTCAPVILGFDTSALREKAKSYILAQVNITLVL